MSMVAIRTLMVMGSLLLLPSSSADAWHGKQERRAKRQDQKFAFKRAIFAGVQFKDGMTGPILLAPMGRLLQLQVESQLPSGKLESLVHTGARQGALFPVKKMHAQWVGKSHGGRVIRVTRGALNQLADAIGSSAQNDAQLPNIVMRALSNAAPKLVPRRGELTLVAGADGQPRVKHFGVGGRLLRSALRVFTGSQ
ncbi:MAG: hypothetical protein JRH20_13135 [Deltaproteobacteria bacterium]|nr:hypothetical protein [Deltaproteobacteria bacterium]